ncbi:MAG TPA: hypothetical protein DCP94_06605, partial [Massilia timonae]|nr:hypothetical protein [Massilia timonae]
IALHARLHATFQEMMETRAHAQWQSLLGTVLRQLPDGVLIVDAAGRCVMANDQAGRMAACFQPGDADGAQDVAQSVAPSVAQAGMTAMLELIRDPVARAIGGETFREALLES